MRRDRPMRGRGRAVAGLLAVVLLAHMALLGALPSRPGREAVLPPPAQAGALPRPLTLLAAASRVEPMSLPTALPAAADAIDPPAHPPSPLPARPTTAPAVPVRPSAAIEAAAVAPARALPAPLAEAPDSVVHEPEPEAAPLLVAVAAKSAATELPAAPPRTASNAASAAQPPPSPPSPDGAIDVPVYATRMPPAASLTYDLRRGLLSGVGELRWRPAGAAYELDLAGTVLGIDVIGWSSRGGFDRAGIAPLRYTDRRRGKALVAANFQREAGRVSFSGPPVTYALVPGTQDRLSWMLQLPAIVEADPARFHAGARIELYVVGAHGEADLWAFAVRGVEPVDVPAGRVEAALLLQREPQRAYDTRVDIWLDPARHHLPARARLTTMPSGDALELSLRQYGSP